MKTTAELEKDIVNKTLKFHNDFPELGKYIDEISENLSSYENGNNGVKSLKDSYQTLEEAVLEYAKTHEVQIEGNEQKPPEMEGYPPYPTGEDIYNRQKEEQDLNPEDPSQNKTVNEKRRTANQKTFDEDMSGDDLDVPGSELDDQAESVGSEDEENNYYSLGVDNHDDLEDQKG